MSWIADTSFNWFQWICANVLKCGPIPQHVAFIMDGNRRYAKKNNVEKIAGHTKGFDKLSETLQWCLDLGIKQVTVYAFSIENFNRSEDEVDSLMGLATQKFQRLLQEKDKLMEQGVRIRVVGNKSLIPLNMVKLISEAELFTKNNNKCFLNIAFAYTARDEMTHAIDTVVNGVKEGLIEEKDISSKLLSFCLHTGTAPEPELLIRTSGETRLSDYMLWQASFSYLFFTDVLWPDFTAWDLMTAIFHYQRAYPRLMSAKEQCNFSELDCNKGITKRGEEFLVTVENRYWENISKLLSSN